MQLGLNQGIYILINRYYNRGSKSASVIGLFAQVFTSEVGLKLIVAQASVLSHPTGTVLCNKTTRNRTVLSFKDSPRKPQDDDLSLILILNKITGVCAFLRS